MPLSQSDPSGVKDSGLNSTFSGEVDNEVCCARDGRRLDPIERSLSKGLPVLSTALLTAPLTTFVAAVDCWLATGGDTGNFVSGVNLTCGVAGGRVLVGVDTPKLCPVCDKGLIASK